MKKNIIKAFIQKVWNKGDADATKEFIASTYTIHHDPGDPWDGRTLDLEGFQERLRESRRPFPDQHFYIQEMFENEKGVCITWLWQGTHQGDLNHLPATGKKVNMSGSTVYFFEGNRITGHWQVKDRLGVFRQLQTDPKPKT